jgi:hypothetical protein
VAEKTTYFRIYGKQTETSATTIAEIISSTFVAALERFNTIYNSDWRDWYGVRVHRMPEGELVASHGFANGETWPPPPGTRSGKPRIAAKDLAKAIENGKSTEESERRASAESTRSTMAPPPVPAVVTPPPPPVYRKTLDVLHGGVIVKEG